MITTSHNPLYWSVLDETEWKLHIAATEDGLCFVGSLGQSLDELTKWAGSRCPQRALIRDDDKLSPYMRELAPYVQGQLKQFTVPLSYWGTPFQQAVWQALRHIPYGQTCSYSDVAHSIGKPAAVRAVGAAIGANPLQIVIPCHRVIGKGGALTGYRGGIDMKSKLLELEKISAQP